MIYKRIKTKYSDCIKLNLWIVFLIHEMSYNNGWIRLFGNWYGLHWKPKTDFLLYSERNGYTKSFILFGYRFKVLKPVK